VLTVPKNAFDEESRGGRQAAAEGRYPRRGPTRFDPGGFDQDDAPVALILRCAAVERFELRSRP
jgi:hypothetical protein